MHFYYFKGFAMYTERNRPLSIVLFKKKKTVCGLNCMAKAFMRRADEIKAMPCLDVVLDAYLGLQNFLLES